LTATLDERAREDPIDLDRCGEGLNYSIEEQEHGLIDLCVRIRAAVHPAIGRTRTSSMPLTPSVDIYFRTTPASTGLLVIEPLRASSH